MTSSIDTAREGHATWLMISTGRRAGRPPPARFAALVQRFRETDHLPGIPSGVPDVVE